MDSRYTTDQQQVLADMARGDSVRRRETSTLVAPGTGVSAHAVTVKSLVHRNVYSVCAVVFGDPGAPPDEIGEPVEATNLAESCHDEGTLPEGACAIMLRLGEQYVFYAKP
ncbi:MAG: hypothetical protein GX448_13495 [Planctomycetes bacterium]|jgi:hypothetical protein|nr:hypothetical protein [Planctomycetota bacterium]